MMSNRMSKKLALDAECTMSNTMSNDELKLQNARCRMQCRGHLGRILEAVSVMILSDQNAFQQQIRSSIIRNDVKIIKD